MIDKKGDDQAVFEIDPETGSNARAAAAVHGIGKVLPAETDVHDRFGNFGCALLHFIGQHLVGICRVDKFADSFDDLDRRQLFYPVLGLDIIEGQLFPVHFHEDVVVWQPARRRMEDILHWI